MNTTSPKDHPTFKRAMSLAHRRLVQQRSKLSERVEELLAQGVADPKEANGIALAELAQRAYEQAVESLAAECSRRARVEYSMSGERYIDEAIGRIESKLDPASEAVAKAMASSRKLMPAKVLCIHEFGLREDGLIFGTTKNMAVDGSFDPLQAKLRKAIERRARREAKNRIKNDGAHPELAEELSRRLMASMAPAFKSIAERSFPSDSGPRAGRSLCARAEDLARKLSCIDQVTLSCDNEPTLSVTGAQASELILRLSAEAGRERPDAGSISAFLLTLGV